MKTINRIYMGLLCLSVVVLSSCGGSDDGGPSTPAFEGTFTGQYTDATTGETSEFIAESVTAVHDTSFFDSHITIKAVNAGGDVITIQLDDTAARPSPYVITPSSDNFTTYVTSTDTATSSSNDAGSELESVVFITHSGMSDNIIEGSISVLKWVLVNPGTEDDILYAVIQGAVFSAPITRVDGSGGLGDAQLSATIDGSAFTAISITSSVFGGGYLISGMNAAAGISITVNIPAGATTGDHDLTTSVGYSVGYTEGASVYSGSEGNINITAINPAAGTITGTFSCTATLASNPNVSVSITNGAFSLE